MGEAVDTVTQLGAAFTKLIELMLSKEIKVRKKKHRFPARNFKNVFFLQTSVDHLNRSCDRASIDAMIELALEGNHLCR